MEGTYKFSDLSLPGKWSNVGDKQNVTHRQTHRIALYIYRWLLIGYQSQCVLQLHNIVLQGRAFTFRWCTTQ